ncbi:MAG TPA: amidohydrolase family protein [Xanthobacteraceae bacterium]|jgi:predicted TIM-barrel fold metal-dependent hydrolase|nr:amidohydrolase family protein [Xanthobacteraceae bacterium]
MKPKGRFGALSGACSCCESQSGFGASALTRRAVLGGGAAAAFGALASVSPAAAQTKPHRIDVHHHVSPAPWVEVLKKAKLDTPPVSNWSVQKSLDDMDQGGVATAVVSPTTPHVAFLERDEAAHIARASNDFAKKLTADHPGRFAMFGMLPLPHVEESLREIEYALDTLKADGVCVLTSYGDKWLGHPQFAPVMDELNRRKATVYTHPTAANCCHNLLPEVGDSIIEYATDTTRTIASLVLSRTTQRCKDISFIFSHGGGTMPFIAERFLRLPKSDKKRYGSWSEAEILAELKRLHYDTAQASHPTAMAALTRLIPVSQIVFGTDYPYRKATDYVAALGGLFGPDDLKAIDRENALRLLPRLKSA